MKETLSDRIYRRAQKQAKGNNYYQRMVYEYTDIYNDYLQNLLINLIDYKNAPETLNVQGLEYMLRLFGYANVVATDKDHIYVDGIGFDTPQINVNFGSLIGGSVTSLTNDLKIENAQPLTRVNAKELKGAVYVTLSNKFSWYTGGDVSDSTLINRTAKVLAEIKAEMLTNIRQQRTPFIGFTKDGNITSKKFYQQLEDGNPFIRVDSDVYGDDVNKLVTIMPTQTPNLAPTLQDSWKNAMSEFLQMIGTHSSHVDKKERLLAQEADQDKGQVSASMNIYVKSRQSQLDLLNRNLGTNIKAEVNSSGAEDVINFAEGKNGLIGDDSNE